MSARKSAATSDLPRLAAPAQRALSGAGLTSLIALSRRTEAEVMDLHGMGPNAMKSLKAAMKKAGVSFAKRYSVSSPSISAGSISARLPSR